MLVYVCVCIFASVWAYETYQGPVNSAKSHESSKVWRGFTSQPFFFFFAKTATATQMKDRYGNQHQQQQQQQEQQQHACGHRKHCKLQAGCGREYILNPHFQVVFFCFLVYPLSFFVFCPHCERKAGQDATWTLQRTLWQSGRGNRGVKRGALEGGGERGVKGAWRLPSDMP